MSTDPSVFFRIEARELLAGLGQGALVLEQAAGDPATVARMLRLAHTLKGAARVVGEDEIAALAHAAEGILAPAREAGGPLPAAAARELLRVIDTMTARVAASGASSPAAAPASLPREEIQTVRLELAEMDALLDGLGELRVHLEGLGAPLEGLEEADRILLLLDAQARSSEAGPLGREADAHGGPGLRAGLDELGGALKHARDELDRLLHRAEGELSLLLHRARRMRLLPVSVLLPALERTARDGAMQLERRVRLTATGGAVRVDAPVHDLLRDALVQVVRNAVAHGIEPPAERLARGKDPVGTVHLTAVRTDAQVVVTCADDGRGIDVAAVERVAIQRGALPPGASLTAEGAITLLVEGGLSTSGTVDHVSGRGVGMNLVQWAVRQANGRLAIRSEPGRGTTVEIRVPATLRAMSALQVEAAGRPYWIPAEAVLRAHRAAAAEVRWEAGRATIAEDGRPVPLVSLRALVGEGTDAPVGERLNIVFVEEGGRCAGVTVDQLLGLRSIVAQPLPPGVADGGPVAYTTFGAAGLPELVLRPSALVVGPAMTAPVAAPSPRPLLVVDDSLTTRILERSILETAGYEVDVAGSGEEGLVRARTRSYALVLVDVEMGGMDGFAFIRALHADPALADTPCVLVTSRDSPADRHRGEQVGAAGYVVKGEFRQEEFLALVRRLVK